MWIKNWLFPHEGSGSGLSGCNAPQVNDAESTVSVEFTPTIPHCSMATLIGLSIKVKLLRSLPDRFKVRRAREGDCGWEN